VGEEDEAKERARVDGDPGGAPADGVGALGGVKDVNLQQHVLDKPLAIPRIKKKGRRNQSFTGGDEFTAAAETVAAAKESGGCSSACDGAAGAKGGAGARARA
jgi:hypothetical protein